MQGVYSAYYIKVYIIAKLRCQIKMPNCLIFLPNLNLVQSVVNIIFLTLSYSSQRGSFTIVPILVGALKPDKEAEYGHLLHKYLLDENNLFVISSDFCHWGKRKMRG